MSNKSEIIDAMTHGIANPLRAKAEAAGNAQIIGMIDKVLAKAEVKPDSYFTAKLYPTHGECNAGAFGDIWRELAAEVAKEG